MRYALALLLALTAMPALSNPIADAARDRLSADVRYDGRYVRLDYPGGDVPAKNRGLHRSRDPVIAGCALAGPADGRA